MHGIGRHCMSDIPSGERGAAWPRRPIAGQLLSTPFPHALPHPFPGRNKSGPHTPIVARHSVRCQTPAPDGDPTVLALRLQSLVARLSNPNPTGAVVCPGRTPAPPSLTLTCDQNPCARVTCVCSTQCTACAATRSGRRAAVVVTPRSRGWQSAGKDQPRGRMLISHQSIR